MEHHQGEPKFRPGTEYYSPYKEPGAAPEGYKWAKTRRHEGKGYTTHWRLESTEPDLPTMDELPPIDKKGKEAVLMDELPGFSSADLKAAKEEKD